MGATWLAEPIFPNDAKTGWAIMKYILTGRFERLTNNKLVNLGRLLRYHEWFYLMTLAAFTLLFFYSLIS